MATPSELFARIMDDIDEIKTVINKLWTNYAKLEQRFDDYVKNQGSPKQDPREHKR